MDLRIFRMIVGISTCMLVFATLTHLTLVCQAQAGKLYHWKDKDGNVYVSDTPPDSSIPKGEVKSTYAPEETANEKATVFEKKLTDKKHPVNRQKEVTIYTNST